MFIDEQGGEHPAIVFVAESSTDHKAGWYFENETYSDMYGPYESLAIAEEKLKIYCRDYLGI